ncbi:hypothetical protein SESBI_47350 [Sesbania bispinosa]|nr:hypothetical protein SESBI_47350 [Sesbania bispinosa]
MKSKSFKNNIQFVFGHSVFGPLSEQKGILTFEDIEEVQNACSETCIEIEDLSVRQALQERPIEWQKEKQKERQPYSSLHIRCPWNGKVAEGAGLLGNFISAIAEDFSLLPLKMHRSSGAASPPPAAPTGLGCCYPRCCFSTSACPKLALNAHAILLLCILLLSLAFQLLITVIEI